MVVWAIDKPPRSAIISTRSRKLSLKRRVPPHAQDDDLAIKVPTIKQARPRPEARPSHRPQLTSGLRSYNRPAICTRAPFGDQAAVKQSVRFRASTLPVGHQSPLRVDSGGSGRVALATAGLGGMRRCGASSRSRCWKRSRRRFNLRARWGRAYDADWGA